MAVQTLATPGVYARDRSSRLSTGTVERTSIFPPRCRRNAGSVSRSVGSGAVTVVDRGTGRDSLIIEVRGPAKMGHIRVLGGALSRGAHVRRTGSVLLPALAAATL